MINPRAVASTLFPGKIHLSRNLSQPPSRLRPAASRTSSPARSDFTLSVRLPALDKIAISKLLAHALLHSPLDRFHQLHSLPKNAPNLFSHRAKGFFPLGAVHVLWRLNRTLDQKAIPVSSLRGAGN